MKHFNGKLWLAVIAICCLSPAAALAGVGHGRGPQGWNQGWGQGPGQSQTCDARIQAPEGGSTGVYLLGIGLTCAGAMFLRSRKMAATK